LCPSLLSTALGVDFSGRGRQAWVYQEFEVHDHIREEVWQGDPLLETAKTFRNGAEQMVVAGIGIEFPTRRNEFAGKVTRLEKYNETFSMDWTINESIGFVPFVSESMVEAHILTQKLSHINRHDLIPNPNISPQGDASEIPSLT
jgi:hypothetical protein